MRRERREGGRNEGKEREETLPRGEKKDDQRKQRKTMKGDAGKINCEWRDEERK